MSISTFNNLKTPEHLILNNMTFNSIANKGFLWNLMYKNGIFNQLSPDYVNKVKDIFEDVVAFVDDNNLHSSLNEKNKKTLIIMTERIIKMCNGTSFVGDANRDIDNNSLNIEHKDTSTHRSETRIKQLEERFKIQKQDMSNTLNAQHPQSIDFSDPPTPDNVENMDGLLTQELSRREREHTILHPRDDANTINENGGQNNTNNTNATNNVVSNEEIINRISTIETTLGEILKLLQERN